MAHLDSDFGVADAVLLQEVSEDAFRDNLKLRFDNSRIYTYIGEVLIAVNPYEDLPIYGAEELAKFRHKALYQNQPHVYALAESAYSTLQREGKDVVVIISGESGAGKTEASKHVMKYIAAVNSVKGAAEIEKVKDMLLACNPLLEAFGNATTLRNDNSSRFGKYMDINFDFKYQPSGGHINNYLLEKARVVHQMEGERNFHIFYQLLAGATDAKLTELTLSRDPTGYNYLKQGGAVTRASDKAAYDMTMKAIRDVGLGQDFVDSLLKVVAAVILLGEIKFQPNGDHSEVANAVCAQDIAKLLGTTQDKVSAALTTRVVAARGEVYTTKLTPDEAIVARDALAKSLYDRTFNFLVEQVNQRIAPKDDSAKSTVLGVLDIYGFEILAQNGFEQFCINYCNEKLQQVFIELVLKTEQAEYQAEGIDWVQIEYFDNAFICNMIDDPRSGMIVKLDEQCALASGSDAGFLKTLDVTLKDNTRYESKQTDATDTGCERERDFRIKHFAGDVVYTTTGFVDKNNDTLFQDLKRMLFECDNPYLKEMWPEGADAITEVHKRPYTAATGFKMSMTKLVDILTSKHPHYIRCIKPNADKAPKKWETDLCVHQIRYLGLMENLRVRRAGYCNRQPYEVFLDRYKMLSKPTWPHWREGAKEGVKHVISALGIDSEVAFGNTKLFIKEPRTLVALEEKRDARIPELVAVIQARWRGVLDRRRVRKIRAIYKIIAFWHASHTRSYINALQNTFKNIKDMPDLGAGVAWPDPPAGLSSFDAQVKQIHMTWRARTIVNKYTPQQQEELKKKAFASDLLQGRRTFWGYQYSWHGNYIVNGPDAAKFGEQMSQLMAKYGDGKIIFSSQVFKLNTKGKQDERVLVVTDKNLYKLDAVTYKIHKVPVPLADILGFAMSQGEDQAVVIRLKADTDLVVTLRGDACSAELVSLIGQATGSKPPVDVDSKITYKVKGQTKNLSFQESSADKTTFTRRASGFALVTRKASMMRIQQRRGAAARGPSMTSIGE
eukprot:m.281080 g.281080  ORF g.281080 m.281080 type:complete len:1009 (+) comp15751_c6_seq3:330-3356(+)